jgi:hypothetical protein
MRHVPVRRDGKTGSSCPCRVLTNEDVDRERTVDRRRSNRTLISLVMRLRFAMTARTRFTLDCTGSGYGGLHRRVSQQAQSVTRSSSCYADGNVGCSIRWPARRETLLHPSGARPALLADALNPAQFVSRRSILPPGNLAPVVLTDRVFRRQLGTTDAERHQSDYWQDICRSRRG